MGNAENKFKIETATSKQGPWQDTGLIEPEPESARMVATQVWEKQPESRPFVRVIREGSSHHAFLCEAGRFRQGWDGRWSRIVERNQFGWRAR